MHYALGATCVALGLSAASAAHAATVSFSLRYQDVLVFSDAVEMPAVGTVTMSDSNGVQRQVNSQSVLGILAGVDDQSSAFSLSSLTYYAGFNSLYLKCVQVANPSVNACDNWQYAVNGNSPFVGMDSHAVQPNDQIFLYFGNSRQVALSKNTALAGEAVSVSAQKYQYQDNTWIPLLGVTIGATLPNSQDPFSPIETVTQSVDGVGNVLLAITQAGDYSVGIKEDFYFPGASLRVLPRVTSGGVSPVSFVPAALKEFDVAKAVDFLASRQKADGSFEGDSMLSDRAAIAFGAYGADNSAREKLKTYLLANPDPGSLVTDYERRAMALMAIGISPYSGAGIDYIVKITASFDGTQIGDAGLVNDDIFALIVLQNAGYGEADSIIVKITEFVLSRQQGNGSWGDVDYTAAAIQALAFQQSEKVKSALAKAKAYLMSRQKDSGGFADNLYSTAWAMQAMSALGEDIGAWQKNGKTPKYFLAASQTNDGGLEQEDTVMNRIWITADAIPAALGKPWSAILGRFEKPALAQQSVPQWSMPQPSSAQAGQAVSNQQSEISNQLEAVSRKLIASEADSGRQLALTQKSEISNQQSAVSPSTKLGTSPSTKFPSTKLPLTKLGAGGASNQLSASSELKADSGEPKTETGRQPEQLTAGAGARADSGIVQKLWGALKLFAAKFLSVFQKR